MKILRTVLCLFLIICIPAACSQNSDDSHRYDTSVRPGINEDINIESAGNDELVRMAIMLGSNFDSVPAEDYKNTWLEYIKNEFNLELIVIDDYNRFKFYDGTYMQSFLNMSNSGGFVYMPSSAMGVLYGLVEEGAILPLQSVLEQNENWNALPEEMKNIYRFEGSIWAVPSEYTYAVYTRKVNKEWLRSTGYAVPENLDELYEVCKAFTFEDPDGDGIDNTTGASLYLPCVIDIFNVFDCRIQPVNNSIQVTSIAYNETSGKFEDSVHSKGMTEALEYCKTLAVSGISDMGTRNEFGTFASFQESYTHDLYHSANHKTINELFSKDITSVKANLSTWLMSGKKNYLITEKLLTDYEHIFSLDNKVTNPVFYNFSGGFYVVDAQMVDPEVSLNRFIDVFMGNQQAYITGTVGLEHEGVTYVHNELSDNKIPPVIGRIPGLYDEKYDDIGIVFGEKVEQARQELSVQLREFAESGRGYDLFPRTGYGIYDKIPYGSFTTDTNGRSVLGDPMMKLFTNMYNSVMNTYYPVSVSDAIAQYLSEASKAGIDEYLQEINEKIGK